MAVGSCRCLGGPGLLIEHISCPFLRPADRGETKPAGPVFQSSLICVICVAKKIRDYQGGSRMKHRTAALCLALVIAVPGMGRAEENVRFPPLSPEQLTPEQKAWADSITAPPRNAKFTNGP